MGWTVRAGAPVAVLLLLVVAITLGGAAAHAAPALAGLRGALGLSAGPVYSVTDLRAALARRPGAWLGRTVRLYAVATHLRVQNCPYYEDACLGSPPVFAAAGAIPATPAASLPLVWGLSDPLRARLRRLPLLAGLVPPQAPHWDRPATYRVVLRRLPGAHCRGCDAAVLLDAAPGAQEHHR